MREYLWILGAIIIAAVLAQALLVTYSMLRRVAAQGEQRRHSVALLDLQLEAARERRQREKGSGLDWVGWRKFSVRRKLPEDANKEICSFYLEPHDGKSIPAFEPGQFLTFRLNTGETKPTVRCYSLSDSPNPKHFRVSIKRVPAPRGTDHPPGRCSHFFHDRIKEGDILDVRAPSGGFFLDRLASTPVVLIGGGVGFTPVLSMLNAIAEDGGKRETWFFYGVRHGGEHAMKQHLHDVERAHEKIKLRVCYSDPRPEDVEGRDFAHRGRVSVDLFKKVLPSNNYEYYICGPPPMMDSITQGLKEWGVPEHHIHTEKFGPGAPRKLPAPVEGSDVVPGVEVTFSKSGKKVNWTSQTLSLLELARAHGVAMDSGCERGDCGTCQTAIRAGDVEYIERPSFGYAPGTCLPCWCKPIGPLELDA